MVNFGEIKLCLLFLTEIDRDGLSVSILFEFNIDDVIDNAIMCLILEIRIILDFIVGFVCFIQRAELIQFVLRRFDIFRDTTHLT